MKWRHRFFGFSLWMVSLSTVQADNDTWQFRVLLDGKSIGTHRFELEDDGKHKTLHSNANFRVTLLGIPVYRYQHQATEQWQGDCLIALRASTNDGGDASRVDLQDKDLPGCVMSYAYWHPLLRTQRRLLNAQTGKLDEVKISQIGSGSIAVRNQQVTATQWRITGLKHPIDLWYGPENTDSNPWHENTAHWLGLDSTVSGGRHLSYRLE